MTIEKHIDEQQLKPRGWVHMPTFLKLTKNLEPAQATFVAMMIMEEYTERRGSPVKGDTFSVIALVRKWSETTLELDAVDKMRPELMRLIFDEDQAGCWTPKPGLFFLDDPPEDDDGA